MHPELARVAFIAAFSLILPLPWHWRARNVATLSIIGWLFILDMIYAIDAIIWAGNVDSVGTVWCDITAKLIVGANFALPAACLCICIHLERVASVRRGGVNIDDKRRRRNFECCMCIGLPVVFMAFHYVVQGHRFDIIEDYGCRPTTYFSIPSIFIVWLPSILMAVGALIFAGLALRHFMIRRLTFATHLSSSNSLFTTSRYIRLMAMASVQMFWSLTTTSYALWFTTISIPLRPWTSWNHVHSDFLRVDKFPRTFTPPLILRAFYVLWWLPIASTFLFVAFFAFGKDAIDEYKNCFSWINIHIFRLSSTSKGFVKFSSSKMDFTLPISSPNLVESSNLNVSNATFTISSKTAVSPSSSKFSPPFSKEAKAIGSVNDISAPQTPSTAATPYYPDVIDISPELLVTASPTTPPPCWYPRTRGCILARQAPASSRPITYPSNDISYQNIDLTKFTMP